MKKLICLVMTLFAVVGFLGAFSPAQAVPFEKGDVFAGGSFGGTGNIYHFRPGTGLLATYSTTFTGSEETGMAFQGNNLLVTNWTASNITKFDNAGTVILPNPFITNDASSHNESIVFDATGNMYIGQADGTRDVIKRDSAGNFLASYDVATQNRGSDWIELAADNKTLYYTSEGTTIFRYDTSTNTQLANFATLSGGTAFALRLLADGTLLVADGVDIKRLDSAGNVIQTYDDLSVVSWFALNIDPDGTSFWSADYSSSQIFQFDIASGAVLDHFNTPSNISGLTVFGERTVVVPLPPTVMLFGFGLAGLGIWRRKFKA
ncbi:MAG: PEP-CTERM sorting domain-containing protein [Desulfobaccales bacterium]